VLLKVPHGPLQGAKNLVPGREIHVKPLVPCPQELRIERSVVGNQLGQVVRLTVGAQLRDGSMPPEELSEAFGSVFGFKGVFRPDTAMIMVLSQAVSVGPAFVEPDLCLEALDRV